MEHGTVYIAPPDRHLLANAEGTLSLTQSELVHFVARPRPPLRIRGRGIPGARDRRGPHRAGKDGAMGVMAIKKMGGTVIAQDEETSEFFWMPSAAIRLARSTSSCPWTRFLRPWSPSL